jgi:hypothetical protein
VLAEEGDELPEVRLVQLGFPLTAVEGREVLDGGPRILVTEPQALLRSRHGLAQEGLGLLRVIVQS